MAKKRRKATATPLDWMQTMIIGKHGLRFRDWLVVRETEAELTIVSKGTGRTRHLSKKV